MTIFSGKKGSGKTIRLIKEANKQVAQGKKVFMIVLTKDCAQIYKDHGLNDEVKVVTYYEYKTKYTGNAKYADAIIYIDEAEWFLQGLFQKHVAGMTIDKENITEVSRADWD